jgi:hypothetical protein
MWHWDQGHLAYFQFDALRQIATFVVGNDFKTANRPSLLAATGLNFAGPDTHSPWRNYSRVLKLCLLVSEVAGRAKPTPVAHILAQPGSVTCDEYLHFLLRTFSEPSPALEKWQPDAMFRYPLLFSLKYLLAKTAIKAVPAASIDEIIGAYLYTGLIGDEDATCFIGAVQDTGKYEAAGRNVPDNLRRQSRESLNVISQISYLHIRSGHIIVSLDPADAHTIFEDLTPVIGPRANNREDEILRLSALFEYGSTSDFFDYPNTIVTDVVESGFREGTKIKKTHITIERNAGLRREFFSARPTATCDVCLLDTAKTYPWTERVMDLHHLLPLSSGTRVEASGTTFDDLVPVCPSCHRAVHRYYDGWLIQNKRKDFMNRLEALSIYKDVKSTFNGRIYA